MTPPMTRFLSKGVHCHHHDAYCYSIQVPTGNVESHQDEISGLLKEIFIFLLTKSHQSTQSTRLSNHKTMRSSHLTLAFIFISNLTSLAIASIEQATFYVPSHTWDSNLEAQVRAILSVHSQDDIHTALQELLLDHNNVTQPQSEVAHHVPISDYNLSIENDAAGQASEAASQRFHAEYLAHQYLACERSSPEWPKQAAQATNDRSIASMTRMADFYKRSQVTSCLEVLGEDTLASVMDTLQQLAEVRETEDAMRYSGMLSSGQQEQLLKLERQAEFHDVLDIYQELLLHVGKY